MSFASAIFRPLPRVSSFRLPSCLALLAAAFAAASVPQVQAQTPGTVDKSFLSGLTGGTIYSLFRYDYEDIQGTPNDFLVVGGDAGIFGRLILSDGLLNDLDNKPDFGDVIRLVYTVVQDKYVNPDKFFVGGAFGTSTTQSTPRQNIYRVNSDFTLDDPSTKDGRPSFNPGQGANIYVTSILPTADKKLVVGGLFTLFNNQPHQHIVRLTDDGVADGTIDSTFNPNLAFDDNILTLAEQLDPTTGRPNGQILAGGLFNNVNGLPKAKLARINNDGSVDTTFNPTFDQHVNIVVAQPDGKTLVGGDFSLVNGVAVQHLVRLNVDGSIDPTFSASVTDMNTALNVNPVSVYTIVLLNDGRMYVGGNFLMINGVARQFMALLQADGAVDPTFDPGTNVINSVQFILPDTTSTGDVFVGETLSPKVQATTYQPSLIALYPPPVNTPAFNNAPPLNKIPQFFDGELPLGGGYDYLVFPNGNVFGYYDLDFHPYLYHTDLGFEYYFDANDGVKGIYFYDFASGHYFYMNPNFSLPYFYDFTLKSVLYYYPVGTASPGHYTTNPRIFFDFATGQNVSF